MKVTPGSTTRNSLRDMRKSRRGSRNEQRRGIFTGMCPHILGTRRKYTPIQKYTSIMTSKMTPDARKTSTDDSCSTQCIAVKFLLRYLFMMKSNISGWRRNSSTSSSQTRARIVTNQKTWGRFAPILLKCRSSSSREGGEGIGCRVEMSRCVTNRNIKVGQAFQCSGQPTVDQSYAVQVDKTCSLAL